jgi:hypothetical protein
VKNVYVEDLRDLTVDDIYQFCDGIHEENQRLEFKREIPARKIAYIASALANAEGGLIVVGVEDVPGAEGDRGLISLPLRISPFPTYRRSIVEIDYRSRLPEPRVPHDFVCDNWLAGSFSHGNGVFEPSFWCVIRRPQLELTSSDGHLPAGSDRIVLRQLEIDELSSVDARDRVQDRVTDCIERIRQRESRSVQIRDRIEAAIRPFFRRPE